MSIRLRLGTPYIIISIIAAVVVILSLTALVLIDGSLFQAIEGSTEAAKVEW